MEETTYIVKVNKYGTKWYLDGQLHRKDGPAIEWIDGDKEWYLYGVFVTERTHKRKMSEKAKGEE